MATPAAQLPIVLVHGAWHGAWCWQPLTAALAAGGCAALAGDLPGHGLKTQFPEDYDRHDEGRAGRMATAPSPLAEQTLDDYADQVVRQIEAARALSPDGRVVLLGHSLGGIAASAAAERMPEAVAAIVYLAAFMLPPGVPVIDVSTGPYNAGELVGTVVVADPMVVGAVRLDPARQDAHYREQLRAAFYGSLPAAAFDPIAQFMTPDVALAPFATPAPVTAARWGSIPRHYIVCERDRAIMPALQRHLIDEVDAAMPVATVRHVLDADHSPFLTAPDALARVLLTLVGDASGRRIAS